jgi:hypothetical protein
MPAVLRQTQPPQHAALTLPSVDWLAAYGALTVELGGFGVGIARWRWLARGQRVIAAWLGAGAMFDIAAIVAARRWHNLQPVARLWFVACVVLAVEALATYQHSRQRVAVLRWVMAGYVLAWLILVATIEPINQYSTYSAPLHALVVLGAAAMTVYRRVSLGRHDLLSDPGFLIGVGLSAYAVPEAFQTLVAQLWINDAPRRSVLYYAMSNGVSALASLVLISALFIRVAPALEQTA